MPPASRRWTSPRPPTAAGSGRPRKRSGPEPTSQPQRSHGFLITLDGRTGYPIRRTTDGGATRTQIGLLPLDNYAPVAAFFLTASTGWVAHGSRLLATQDGGATWTARDINSLTPVALDFVSAKVGWLEDSSGALQATDDGGATWHAPGPGGH